MRSYPGPTAVTPLGRSVERAVRTCMHSLVLCARAEEVACAALAVHDPYGQAGWDAVRWTHFLDGLARSHTRAQLIRARLEEAHLKGPDPVGSWQSTGTDVPCERL